MDRSEYTRLMWQLLPDAIKEAQPFDSIQHQWWHDARPNGGWRLTWSGYVDLSDQLQLETWDFDFPSNDIAAWMYLKLKNYMDTPYYIITNRKHTRVTVFDSKIAVAINLYGDIKKFIKGLD